MAAMRRAFVHKITAWLTIACYLAGTSVAGLFHHHADLEGCGAGCCAAVEAASEEPLRHEHSCAHSHQHAHSSDCPHHAPQRDKPTGIQTVAAGHCDYDCMACRLLSQVSVQAKVAKLEFLGEQVAAV
jgi:hypothetical protein